MFESRFDEATGTLTFVFSGRMDNVRSNKIEGELLREVDEFVRTNEDLSVVFELGEVEYVASSFIRICLAAAKGVKEGRFSIVHTHPMIKKIFKIAGLDKLLNVS